MTENVENLILEHLRGLRNQVEGLQGEMRTEFRDVKQRLSHLETLTVGLKRDGVELLSENTRQQHELDRLKDRIERIEKRLELTD
jgi:regulator of replication initiation timing